MKDEELLLIGGLVLAYLILTGKGQSAAQAQIAANNLQAQNTVANTNAVSNAAIGISTDLSQIASAFES